MPNVETEEDGEVIRGYELPVAMDRERVGHLLDAVFSLTLSDLVLFNNHYRYFINQLRDGAS